MKKINNLDKQKHGYLIHTWSDKAFKGYSCKSGIAIFAGGFTLNYVYSPFKLTRVTYGFLQFKFNRDLVYSSTIFKLIELFFKTVFKKYKIIKKREIYVWLTK